YTSAAGATSATVSVQNNDLRGIVHSVAGSNSEIYFSINRSVNNCTVAYNTLTNINTNTSGSIYMFYDNLAKSSGQTTTYDNNSIVTGFTNPTSVGSLYGIWTSGLSSSGSFVNITNNNFSNINSGCQFVFPIAELEGLSSSSGPSATVTGNTISNVTGTYGFIWVIHIDAAASINCSSNSISNISGTGPITGIYIDGNNGSGNSTLASNVLSGLSSTGTGGSVMGMYNTSSLPATVSFIANTVTNLSSTGASANVSGIYNNSGNSITLSSNLINNISASGTTAPFVTGINVVGGTTLNIYLNKLHTISATGAYSGASVLVAGINLAAGITVNVYNNFVSDLTAPGASSLEVMRGISVISLVASSNYYLYYNSIYLDASSTGTDFGTTGIYHTVSATASTAALTMIDNIVKNTSTAGGTGFTVAFKNSGTALNNFSSSSDYNLYYAGTPSATNLIFYNGTNSDQTLTAYQTRVSPREANSISVSPNFTSATNLHILSTSNCAIEGRGTPVGGYITDIDGATRNATTPDIGADEFSGAYSTLAGIAGTAVCENKTVSATGSTYANSSCNLITYILPSGGSPVSGK
ncbi:MAG TPA: hypothetical protein VKH37_01370, partial [Ferruginibacter sp.]|nr:hypothetical protein [Ferruginibacter sp.]